MSFCPNSVLNSRFTSATYGSSHPKGTSHGAWGLTREIVVTLNQKPNFKMASNTPTLQNWSIGNIGLVNGKYSLMTSYFR
jgi:GH25 family lysozyme M1 (1,4-beta-N-acetylmuramidase)